jgi:hypothetical protein
MPDAYLSFPLSLLDLSLTPPAIEFVGSDVGVVQLLRATEGVMAADACPVFA